VTAAAVRARNTHAGGESLREKSFEFSRFTRSVLPVCNGEFLSEPRSFAHVAALGLL